MSFDGAPFQMLDYVKVVKRGSIFKGMKGTIVSMTFHPWEFEVYFDKPPIETKSEAFLRHEIELIKPTWWRRWWWKRWPSTYIRSKLIKQKVSEKP